MQHLLQDADLDKGGVQAGAGRRQLASGPSSVTEIGSLKLCGEEGLRLLAWLSDGNRNGDPAQLRWNS